MAKKSKKPAKVISVGRAEEKNTARPVSFMVSDAAYDLKHNRPLAALLGDIIVAWSAVDTNLVRLLMVILNKNWEICSGVYFTPNGFGVRYKLLLTIIKRAPVSSPGTPDKILFPQALKKKILKSLGTLNSLDETRNKLVHGSWTKDLESDFTFCRNYRKGEKDKNRNVDISIETLEDHLEKVQNEAKFLGQAGRDLSKTLR